MATGNFPACLEITLSHEGGWSDHPRDPGGATMRGVTLARYREYYPRASKDDLRRISDDDLTRIYRADYWNAVRGDALPYGVDLATFDFGVNSGPSRAARHLQAVVGVAQDGVVGPVTVDAVTRSDPRMVIKTLCASRMSFVRRLSTWSTFGKGWSRRIADIEAKAVAMCLAKGGKLSDADRDALRDEAADAKRKSGTQAGGAGSIAVGGGAVASYDLSLPVVITLACLIAGAAYLVWRSRQNADRAAAYSDVASK